MVLLDTNIVSELRRARPHGGVLAWLQGVPDRDLYLCAVTLGEIQAGLEITRSRDADKASEIEAWLDQVASSYQLLPVDGAAFRLWARLMHGRTDHLIEDAMIAAVARVHESIVVSRNLEDFDGFGVRVLNPFEMTA